mmetsp:Transcript_37749/g.90308  ORF Transcript_37749/g.90308 Transcript_37749/m.90308 type:complete len:203 (-) Transcript_37749:10-618(-)
MISCCLSSNALPATDRRADCALRIRSSSAACNLACSSNSFFRCNSASAAALASFSFCSASRALSWAAWILFSSGLLFPVVGAAVGAALSAAGRVEMPLPPPKSFSLRSRSWTRSSAVAFGGIVCRCGVTPSATGAGGSCRAAGFACSIIMFVRSAETPQQTQEYKSPPAADFRRPPDFFACLRFFDLWADRLGSSCCSRERY